MNPMIDSFHPLDGTVEFYGRISAVLKSDFTVADVGAGRAAWWFDDPSSFRKSLRTLRGRVAKVIGLDVDRAVLDNPATDENKLIEDGRLPLADESVDVVICDYVLEHILNPVSFELEVRRVLKPGGLFCARTPHVFNYVSIGAALLRNAWHAKVLRMLQPDRQAEDVFPTAYRCNSMRALRKFWTAEHWDDHSYLYTAEPSYTFNSRFLFWLLSKLHKFGPSVVTGNLFVFMIKRPQPRNTVS